MARNMEKEHIIIKMVTSISATGSKIKKMVWVFYNTHQVLYTMDNGSMIKPVIRDK